MLILMAGIIISGICALKTGSEISLENTISQMIVIGFHGDDLSKNPEFKSDLCQYGVGGVILYNRDSQPEKSNITSKEQVLHLTGQIRASRSLPPLIAVDQEGGDVARLKEKHGFQTIMSAREIGRLDNEAESFLWAEAIASDLCSAGIDLNLAPVVDLSINPQSPGLGKSGRCFSDDPSVVTQQTKIFCTVMNSHWIHCCLKHFPGHGSAVADSHFSTSDITATWRDKELLPYKAMIAVGYSDLIMVSHVQNGFLDNEHPASLSKKVVDGLLRERLGWQGVVITDDLQMKAVSIKYSLKERIRLAILAGNDLLLFGNSGFSENIGIRQIVEIIKNLLTEGQISISSIWRSLERIRRLKAKFIDN
jgi:beta-N-acetylhexosaminidase